MNQKRCQRLSLRLSKVPILVIILIVGMTVFLLDLFTNLIWDFLVIAKQNFLLMGSITMLVLFVFILTLSSSNPRKILKHVWISLFYICLSAVVLEFTFRFVLLSPKVPRTKKDFQHQIAATWPKKVHPRKGSDAFRILGLADSFGQAGGHLNYHYILERLLSERWATVEVVNFSMGEYEPKEELELIKRFGPVFQPDLVLHGFFIGNDFSIPDGKLYSFRNISARLKGGIRGWLPHQFASREWLRRLVVLLNEKASQNKENFLHNSSGTFSRKKFLEIERSRLKICKTGGPMEPFQKSIELLKQIRSKVDAMNAMLVMVIHPDQYQVETELFLEICREYSLNHNDYDLEKPQRIIRTYCARNGITCVDLLPSFREHGSGGGLYIPRNTHYNDLGNRLAAVEIVKSLQGFLPHME